MDQASKVVVKREKSLLNKLKGIEFRLPLGVRETILSTMRQAIVSKQFKPGERITERILSEHFKTSTTPVKEALRILEAEGLIRTIPRKGTFISDFSSMHLLEMFNIRAALEGLAAKFAAEKATKKDITDMENILKKASKLIKANDYHKLVVINTLLHKSIRIAANNYYLQHLIDSIVSYDNIVRKAALNFREEQEVGWREHSLVVEAIKNQKPEEAEERIRNHIIRSGKLVLASKSSDFQQKLDVENKIQTDVEELPSM